MPGTTTTFVIPKENMEIMKVFVSSMMFKTLPVEVQSPANRVVVPVVHSDIPVLTMVKKSEESTRGSDVLSWEILVLKRLQDLLGVKANVHPFVANLLRQSFAAAIMEINKSINKRNQLQNTEVVLSNNPTRLRRSLTEPSMTPVSRPAVQELVRPLNVP